MKISLENLCVIFSLNFSSVGIKGTIHGWQGKEYAPAAHFPRGRGGGSGESDIALP